MAVRVNLWRFRTAFPIAAFVVGNIWKLLPVFALVAALAGIFSVHYGLSVMCVWMGIVCFWVDRKHLNYCLFTPLQPMAVILIMSLGAGISMVMFNEPEKYSYGFLCMQLAGLLGFPLFMAGYWLVFRRVPGFVFPQHQRGANASWMKALVLVGWFCLLHELGKVVSGVVSGTSDRGFAGDFQLEQRFGWWSAFGIFSMIQTLGYVLVPLIWRESRLLGRVLLGGVVTVILFLHFVAASRGQFFFPIFIFMVGSFMFLKVPRVKYEWFLFAGILGLAPLVTLMSNYRSTRAFQETDIRNVFAKVGTLKQGLAREAVEEATTGEKLAEAGRSFVGVADNMIYEMTPSEIAHEGFGRLDGMFWTFVPYILYSHDRPVMQDGYLIVSSYRGYMLARTSIGISFPAEMYRRWGWFAVPVGLFLYGLFYGSVFRYVYRLYLFRNALWGFVVCSLLFNFFVSWCFSTALDTFWQWFYQVPKHLLLLGLVYAVVKRLTKTRTIPGALLLMPSARSRDRVRHRPQGSVRRDDPAGLAEPGGGLLDPSV